MFKKSKDAKTPGSDNNGIVVGRNNISDPIDKGKLLKRIVLASLLIIVPVGAYLVTRQIDKPLEGGYSTKGDPNRKPTDAREKASGLAALGNVQAAKDLLDEELKKATTPEQKKKILLSKGLVLYQSKEYKSALTLGLEAEKYGEDKAVSDFIASAAEKAGNIDTAITYLEKSIKQLNTESPLYDQEVADINAKIEELKKL